MAKAKMLTEEDFGSVYRDCFWDFFMYLKKFEYSGPNCIAISDLTETADARSFITISKGWGNGNKFHVLIYYSGVVQQKLIDKGNLQDIEIVKQR